MTAAGKRSADRRLRHLGGWAAAAAALLAVGCGSGEGTDTTTAGDADAQPSSCAESFASTAPETLPRLATLSHAQGAPVTIGTYSGEQFSAEVYDVTTTGDGSDETVEPGACVVTEVSKDFGPLYLFVQAGDGSWHRLLESDPDVPLVPDPEAELDGIERVEIDQIGA